MAIPIHQHHIPPKERKFWPNSKGRPHTINLPPKFKSSDLQIRPLANIDNFNVIRILITTYGSCLFNFYRCKFPWTSFIFYINNFNNATLLIKVFSLFIFLTNRCNFSFNCLLRSSYRITAKIIKKTIVSFTGVGNEVLFVLWGMLGFRFLFLHRFGSLFRVLFL